jgi:hypothetical protein
MNCIVILYIQIGVVKTVYAATYKEHASAYKALKTSL